MIAYLIHSQAQICLIYFSMLRRRRRRLKGIHYRSDTNKTGAERLSFYYPRLLHCLDQMLAVMSLSQHRVSSSKTVRTRAGAALKSWLRDFLSSCLRQLKIPKIWRRALVVAIPKPAKPVGDPKSYRPISLLCVPYKILERLIYARVEPLIDPLIPKEQAGFRRGKSTVDQVVLLTQNIEDSFEAKKKACAVFIDLTAAYDTVWHRGLTCKLLRLLPGKHMVKMILSEIEVSPLPPVTASKAGYAVLKTAFLRDRSWLPFYLTSIRTIFLP